MISPKNAALKDDKSASLAKKTEESKTELSQHYVSEKSVDHPEKEDFSGAIFERMIIILPYMAPDYVKSIEGNFERINMENF